MKTVTVNGKELELSEYFASILPEDEVKELMDVLEAMQNDNSEKQLIMVGGPQIATGKTTLVKILQELGINAIEEYQVYQVELTRKQ